MDEFVGAAFLERGMMVGTPEYPGQLSDVPPLGQRIGQAERTVISASGSCPFYGVELTEPPWQVL
jgi:hypothetical protein